MYDVQKFEEAKQVLMYLANGYNPLDGTPIEPTHFLHDPRVIRPLYYLLQHLNEPKKRRERRTFSISQEQLDRVVLPEGDIGINTFCRCVNAQIDEMQSKKLTHKPIYNKLKQLGILEEVQLPNGKKRTTINERSGDYGIKEIQRTFNGRTYEQVVFDDVGKAFLLSNLLKILELEDEPIFENA